jgi:hypothetical protein
MMRKVINAYSWVGKYVSVWNTRTNPHTHTHQDSISRERTRGLGAA